MLRRMDDMIGFEVRTADGDAGKIDDFLFEEEDWGVRYVVVDTGPWIFGRKVLISPEAIGDIQWQGKRVVTSLSRERIENSPDVDVARPVSHRQVNDLHQHYGWQAYWGGTVPMGRPGAGPYVGPAPDQTARGTGAEPEGPGRAPGTSQDAAQELQERDPRLHSVREVVDYTLRAQDGDIGRVNELFVDEDDWTIHYLVAETRTWFGKDVLIPIEQVASIDWEARVFDMKMSREEIKGAPEYEPEKPVSRAYQSSIHEYYGVPGYWHW
jgi:uncharacterized protein YrrD